MSTSTNHPGAVACLQRPGNSQQFATHYQLLQPTTMQQVPEAPIVQAAPMQHVNQVAPQQVYAPQYQPLQCHGQAHQYHGGNQVAYSAQQQGGIAQIVVVSILIAVMVCVLVWGGCKTSSYRSIIEPLFTSFPSHALLILHIIHACIHVLPCRAI